MFLIMNLDFPVSYVLKTELPRVETTITEEKETSLKKLKPKMTRPDFQMEGLVCKGGYFLTSLLFSYRL